MAQIDWLVIKIRKSLALKALKHFKQTYQTHIGPDAWHFWQGSVSGSMNLELIKIKYEVLCYQFYNIIRLSDF